MTLNEAKEQIAKENKFNDWIELVNESDDIIVFSKFEDAVNLVLFSKDKEIAELKEKLSEANNSLKYASEDAMEYKDKITHLKEMWKQCSDREIRITDILRSEIKTLESELSQLKEYVEVMHKTEDKYRKQIQSLQEENKRLKNAGETFYKDLLFLREEMKKKEEQIRVLFGKCVEKNCERPAVIDYNGHKHYVCQAHYDSLTRYFEEEYK